MSNTQQHPRALRWLGKAPRGATHPQLFALEDEAEVVVKFSQNPQGERVLANEFICSGLAALLGLPVPGAILVDVPDALLDGARVAGACPAEFKGGSASWPRAVERGGVSADR